MSNWKRTSTYCFILAGLSVLGFIYANLDLYVFHYFPQDQAESHAAGAFVGMFAFPIMGWMMRITGD